MNENKKPLPTGTEGQGEELKRKSDKAEVISVIRVNTTLGRGTEESPFRNITEYWSLAGNLLAVREG